MSLKINIEIMSSASSKRYSDFNSAESSAPQHVLEQITREINLTGRRIAGRDAVTIANSINKMANKELNKVVDFMHPLMFVHQSPKSGTYEIAPSAFSRDSGKSDLPTLRGVSGGMSGANIGFRMSVMNFADRFGGQAKSLKWPALSRHTVKKKRSKTTFTDDSGTFHVRDPETFYVDLGPLSDVFQSLSPEIFKTRFGGVDVEVDEKMAATTERRPVNEVLAAIRIRILPRMHPGMVKGLRTGDWTDASRELRLERALLDSRSVEKLRGYSKRSFRPLMQPVLAFWVLYRIPRTIRGAIARSLNPTARDRRTASSDNNMI